MRRLGRALPFAAILAVLCALAGCLDVATTVTVKPDGSGTVERTLVVSSQLVDLMVTMGMGADEAAVRAQMVKEEDLRADADKMGDGVTFVSSEAVSTDKGEGLRAVYQFDDVTKLRIDQSPSSGVSMPESPTGEGQPAGPEFVTFGFTKGKPATLTIRTPRPAASTDTTVTPATPPEGAEEAAQMMEMFRGLYEDMRIRVAVVVQGTITSTNAAYVDGATVTLMDLDFGSILKDDQVFQKLATANTQSLLAAQDTLKAVPGVKMETQENVTISFR